MEEKIDKYLLKITDIWLSHLTDDVNKKIKCYASLTFNNILVVKGFRVVDGSKGLFVAMPSSIDKSGVYHDSVYMLNKNAQQYITKTIMDEFEKRVNEKK